VGAILGGSVFLWLSENLGWQVSVLITVCLIAGAGLPAFALRPTAAAGGASQLHGRAIQHRGTWFIVVLSALAALADGFLGAWLVDSGFSAVQVGWYLGLVAMLAMLPFAYLASVMLRRLGQGRTLSLLFAAKAALLAVLFIVPVSPMAGVVVAVSIFALSAGLLTSMWQLYMKAVNASYAATGFAFLTSVEAMLLMLGGFLAGQIALRFGYDPLFFIASLSAAVASLLAIPPDISSFG
jgi:predicted MFS family arabinose efflux permease